MQVKFVMFKDGKRRDIDVPEGVTTVGRTSDCGVRVPVENVSRKHCQVTIKDDAVMVKDLGSSNGTYVNDRRVTEQSLRPGDMVRIGPVTFTVQINGKPAQIAAPEDVAALMGNDDSGEIPDMALDEITTLDEPSSDKPAKTPATETSFDINELDALDALDLLDDSDDDIGGAAKTK